MGASPRTSKVWGKGTAEPPFSAFPLSTTTPAAAIVVDGEIVAAAQEERFTRKKHDARSAFGPGLKQDSAGVP